MAPWRTVTSSEPGLAGTRFTLLRCPRCGSARTLEPAPARIHEAGAYGPQTPRLHRAAGPVLRAFDRHRLAMLAPLVPAPGTLLDAGAGRGRFVAAARAAGYDAFGIEPSTRGAAAAAAIGAPVQRVGIESAEIEDGSLDCVTLWHVLEHLDDPSAALGRIAGWLAPGGALLVGVPNLASLQARLSGERWYHLDVPRHRVHFTAAGLDQLLRGHGLEPVRVHHVLLEQNPFGMWQSLLSLITRQPSYLYNLLKRNASARSGDLAISVAALPLAPAAGLLELGAGLARRGGTIAVLARRGEYD
jgi:SAM-dependent methyltransferase